MRASWRLTSRAVPRVGDGREVAVDRAADTERDIDDRPVTDAGMRGVGKAGGQGVEQLGQSGVWYSADGFSSGASDEVGCEFVPVVDVRAQRPEHEAKNVHGRLDGGEVNELTEELLGSVVGADEVPVAVHHDAGERFVSGEDPVERG